MPNWQIINQNHFHNRKIPSTEIGLPSIDSSSHLGPILFLIFINDLSLIFEDCNYLLFADDLKIYRQMRHSSDFVFLQNAISKLSMWCKENKMILNISKCKVISFTRKRVPMLNAYHIENLELIRTNLVNDLGVLFDTELRFTQHIDGVVAKAYKMTGFIMRQCWEFRDIELFKTVYCALVRSGLEYCSIVWSPCYQVHIKRIERVQSRFANFLLFKLNIDKDQLTYAENICRRTKLSMSMGHKILNNKINCPDILALIKFRVPSRPTRQPNYGRTDYYIVRRT